MRPSATNVGKDVPQVPSVYVHRCGRTARGAVLQGRSILFVSPQEQFHLSKICDIIGSEVRDLSTSESVCALKTSESVCALKTSESVCALKASESVCALKTSESVCALKTRIYRSSAPKYRPLRHVMDP